MQRELTATLGTVGATHVRFLFGFPFALISLAGLMLVTGAAAAAPSLRYLAVDRARRRRADRGHRADAGCDGRALLRRHHRLYQDRAGPGRAVRADLPRRRLSAGMVAAILIATAGVLVMSLQAGRHPVGRPAGRRCWASGAGAMFALVGDRLSRRDPQPRHAGFRDGRDLHAGRRPRCCRRGCCRSICCCASRKVMRDIAAGLAAVTARRISGRAGVAILVPGLCASRPPRACARSRWSRFCSRRRSRASCSVKPRPRREAIGIVLVVIGVALLLWSH